ncbi:Ionotropic glutamate receptor [Macleaya cordata]|uniref:Glutamate receptor n=1 Tax=Macleaya cordata TaxID=56857 RepID=A0A200PZN4_MACCD|nr:Ionotropic glutamate receptor [Macleaya cordata]
MGRIALDLIKNVRVQAIIGPETSEEADFITYMGNKAHIPIISFSAISSSLSPIHFPYFVRVAQNDSSQVKAIVAVVQAYRWKELSIIHDDSQSRSASVLFLTDALQKTGTLVSHRTVLPTTANETIIKDSLRELRGMSTRVFIVHLSSSLGTRFFLNAHKEGMMQSGCVWIITCELTDLMAYMDPSVIYSMNGVIGVKTHVPPSKALRKFKLQWRRHFEQDHLQARILQPNVYALWAYDAIFLMAMAANRVRSHLNRDSPSSTPNNRTTRNMTDLFDTGVSPMGSKFLQSVRTTQFTGLSGEIQLVDGQLESSAFKIVNVIGKRDQPIGYWTPNAGLSQSLEPKDMDKNYSANTEDFGVVTWPGGTKATPRAMKLKIGVPCKSGFVEFVNVSHCTNSSKVSGFSTDIFDAVMQGMPYEYEYIPFGSADGVSAGDYDNLTYHVFLKQFDIVVGDVTIIANRSKYVDFTQPYSLSGVQLIVPRNEDNFTKSLWWFTTPLTKELWFTTILFFVFKGILVLIFENGRNPEFQGSRSQQLGKVLSFSFSTLVFANREKLESNYSRFIVNMWTFAVFILVTCFGANLTSMLTIKNLQVTNIDSLRMSGKFVGYQSGSFVLGLLKDLRFDERNLKQLSTVEEYAEALRNGSVSAILDELPYIRVFLAKYCREFTVTGPTYPTGGFGFVFPKDSPLLSDVSKSVLEFAEGESMHKGQKIHDIENKWFGSEICGDPLLNDGKSNPLQLYSFESIFITVGGASVIALFMFFVSSIHKKAKDGSLAEMLNKKSLGERFCDMSRCFRFNKKKPPPRETEQPQKTEEMHQIHEQLPDTSSVERQGTNDNDERHGIIKAGSLVIEMTPADNHSEITVVEEVTPTHRIE